MRFAHATLSDMDTADTATIEAASSNGTKVVDLSGGADIFSGFNGC